MHNLTMETIREQLEKIEEQYLSKYACLSKNSLGRDVPEVECTLRTQCSNPFGKSLFITSSPACPNGV